MNTWYGNSIRFFFLFNEYICLLIALTSGIHTIANSQNMGFPRYDGSDTIVDDIKIH